MIRMCVFEQKKSHVKFLVLKIQFLKIQLKNEKKNNTVKTPDLKSLNKIKKIYK